MSIESHIAGYGGYREVDPSLYLDQLRGVGVCVSRHPRIFTPKSRNPLLLLLYGAVHTDSPYLWQFALNKHSYGESDYQEKAMFVREEDPITILHELTHFWTKQNFPTLYEVTAEQDLKKVSPLAPFIQQALREGSAQWAAVQGCLRWEDPQVRARAIRTHNLMATGQKIDKAVETARVIIGDYQGHNPKDLSIRWNRLRQTLGQTYVPLTSLGYVYITKKISLGLQELLNNPPKTLEEIYQK